MGSGKSYWGHKLETRVGVRFADLDTLIEAAEGQTIADIFAERGEAAFRALERAHLHTLAQAPCLVATGGGTPCFFDNADWMNAHGLTIFLDASVDLLVERLAKGRQKRPLLHNLPTEAALRAFVEERLASRLPFYEKAAVRLVQDQPDAVTFAALLAAVQG